MTLCAPSIERYSRQIILPEVGGGGQERILSASVTLLGSGAATSLCAAYLAGAGVGRISLAPGPANLEELVHRRNPDCRAAREAPAVCDVIAGFGPYAPVPSAAPVVLWGTIAGSRLIHARVPAGSICADCLAASFGAERESASATGAVLLGALVATDVLRSLLGLADLTEPRLVRFDLDSGAMTTDPLRARPQCPACSSD